MRVLVVAALLFTACGRVSVGAGHSPIDGIWQLDLERSHYAGTAEPRLEETFTCATRNARTRCEIVSVRQDGDTTRAAFTASPGKGDGPASGVPGVDRVRLERRPEGLDAVFLNGEDPVLGYRITVDGDSMVVQTTDPRSGDLLDTRIVYQRLSRPTD